MAETLKSWPLGTHRSKHEPYPWEKWFNGRIWELRQGTDYYLSTSTFRGVVGSAARDRGLKVRTAKIDGGAGIVIQALGGAK